MRFTFAEVAADVSLLQLSHAMMSKSVEQHFTRHHVAVFFFQTEFPIQDKQNPLCIISAAPFKCNVFTDLSKNENQFARSGSNAVCISFTILKEDLFPRCLGENDRDPERPTSGPQIIRVLEVAFERTGGHWWAPMMSELTGTTT